MLFVSFSFSFLMAHLLVAGDVLQAGLVPFGSRMIPGVEYTIVFAKRMPPTVIPDAVSATRP